MDAELEALLDTAKANLNPKSGVTAPEESDEVADVVKAIPKLNAEIKADESGPRESIAEQPLKHIPLRNIRPQKPDTAGGKWFDMKAPELTPELKRDLHILKNRHVLDPKRFYKKEDAPSKYFAMGTIKEDPTEFFSARLTRKQRKRTLAEEILSTRGDYFDKKYKEIAKSQRNSRILKKRQHQPRGRMA